MMRRCAAFGLGFLAMVAAACADDGTGIDLRPRVVDRSEIQVLESSPEFVDAREAVLYQDALWVLDGAAPFLTRVSLSDGQALRLGGEGKGPDEFIRPWSMQVVPGSRDLRVWDLGSGRAVDVDDRGFVRGSVRLDDEGRAKALSTIRQVSYADPFRVRFLGTGVVTNRYPGRVNGTADLNTGEVWQADARLSPDRPLAHYVDHVSRSVNTQREWAAVPLWDVCGDRLALWSPKASGVMWLDTSGNEVGSATLPTSPRPLEEREIESYLRWMARLELGPDYEKAGVDFEAMAKSARDQFAEHAPVATDLRCESRHSVWLRLFDASTDPLGRGSEWLRVDTEGPASLIRFPDGFTPLLFSPSGVYGVLETPGMAQRLARWSEADPSPSLLPTQASQ